MATGIYVTAFAYSDLTVPEPNSSSARDVLSHALKHLLRDLQHLSADHAIDPEGRAEYLAFRKLVLQLLKSDPGALASLLRHPTVAVYIRCLRDRPPGDAEGARLLAALVATACFELASAGALPRPIRFTRFPHDIPCLPGQTCLRVPDDALAIAFDHLRVTIEREGEDVSFRLDHAAHGDFMDCPYLPIRGNTVLALFDNNPLSNVEAHPDKQGNRLDLGNHRPAEWVHSLASALDLVEAHMPDLREEMELFVSQIVPVGWDDHKHLSASYQESIGTVYLTLHPHTMTMAEALIHEFSHNKLNALFELDPVLHNAFSPLFTSPVRPDPRPLHGVLLAVHAFLPVEALYDRMREAEHPLSQHPDFERRYAQIVESNREGAAVLLDNAEVTEVGRPLLDEIERLARA